MRASPLDWPDRVVASTCSEGCFGLGGGGYTRRMRLLSIVIVLIAVVIAIVVVAIVLSRQGHPEGASRHVARHDDPEDDKMLRAPGSSPGGPGQSGQDVVDPGEIAPGETDVH